MGLTYDTGALIAADRDYRLMWALHRAAIVRGLPPTVPVGVLAEAWRGGPQHRLSRLLKGCNVEEWMKPRRVRCVGSFLEAVSMTSSMWPSSKERFVEVTQSLHRTVRISSRLQTRSASDWQSTTSSNYPAMWDGRGQNPTEAGISVVGLPRRRRLCVD